MLNTYKLNAAKILLHGILARKKVKRHRFDKPIILELMTTYKCNCQCQMCNIWKKGDKKDLSLKDLERLFSDPVLSDLKTVTLSGGELFLRKDLLELCRLLNKNCKELNQLYLSTNGSEAEKNYNQVQSILSVMTNIQRLRLGISFDHIGSLHDKIRKKKGIHENALRFVQKLCSLKDDRVSVQANIAIGPHNVEDIMDIYEYFQDLNLKVFWFPIMVSENFFENQEKNSQLAFTETQKEKMVKFFKYVFNKCSSLNDFYYYGGLLEMFLRGKRTLPCTAGKCFIQINAAGDTFPCYIIPKKHLLGSIREKSLSEIWHYSYSENIRKQGKLSSTCDSCVQWYDGYALGQNVEYFLKLVLSHPIIFTKSLGRYLGS